MTSRQQDINVWVSSLLPTIDLNSIKYMQSDASQRKYLRVRNNDNSFVIMDTVPGQELINFIKIAKILTDHDISAPEILDYNLDLGLALLTDLGSTTYLEQLRQAQPEQINTLYLDAIDSLLKIQSIQTDASCGYDFKLMDQEYIVSRLEVFSTWYLEKHLSLELSASLRQIIMRMQEIFQKAFLQLSPVLVHVDYHCRNLMYRVDKTPGVLDFQDAMRGPVTYDLASLFQDAYISWPRAQVEKWVNAYRLFAIDAGIIPNISADALLRNFDLVGLQRHIKNLGVFARLHHRDGKSNYLHDMPMLLKYINETCARYAELEFIGNFISEHISV
jgi:aminoglycoside/choline kinase family phosphotransferase